MDERAQRPYSRLDANWPGCTVFTRWTAAMGATPSRKRARDVRGWAHRTFEPGVTMGAGTPLGVGRVVSASSTPDLSTRGYT